MHLPFSLFTPSSMLNYGPIQPVQVLVDRHVGEGAGDVVEEALLLPARPLRVGPRGVHSSP